MPTSTDVTNLKINQLTQAQYDTAVQQGVIGENELSVLTDVTDKSVQVSTMPTASADELGNIYQYVGISGTYTNGYFYKCVSDGGNPANYWWEPIPTQETTSFVSKWENYDNIGASAVAIASIVSFSITPEGSSTYVGTESLLEISTTDGNSTLKIKLRFDIGGVGEQEVVEETGAFVGARLYLAEDAPGSYRLIVKKADDSAFVSESTYITCVYSKYGVTRQENDGWYSTTTVYSTATKFPEKIKPSGLPDQTGQSGKFLTTDGTDASWSDKPLVNTATGTNSYVIGGNSSYNTGNNDVVIGANTISRSGGNNVYLGKGANSLSSFGARNVAAGSGATTNGNGNVSVGYLATATNGSAQVSINTTSTQTNSDANTFKVANANGNFEIMSADGTVPTARLTKVNTTAILAVADWSSNTQTVTVSGVKADSVVFVSPAPASASDYASAGILCTAQAADSLTFTATTTPTNAITVNIICM